MPRTFTAEQEFRYPWQLAARAVWNKYPNPNAGHVVSVDVLEQGFDARTGRLRTERILGVRQGAPRWLLRLTGALGTSEDTYVREVVMVDPVARAVEMTSTNLSLSEYMLVKEYITYTPAAPAVTRFRQIADISCTGLTGILASAARRVENWSFNRFADNAAHGRSGLLAVLNAMYGPPVP